MCSMVDEKNRFNPNIQIAAIASRRSFSKTAVAAAVLGSATPGALLAQQKEEAVPRRSPGADGRQEALSASVQSLENQFNALRLESST
jgi:hypothetical protein